jgi:hypothetical protein
MFRYSARTICDEGSPHPSRANPCPLPWIVFPILDRTGIRKALGRITLDDTQHSEVRGHPHLKWGLRFSADGKEVAVMELEVTRFRIDQVPVIEALLMLRNSRTANDRRGRCAE